MSPQSNRIRALASASAAVLILAGAGGFASVAYAQDDDSSNERIVVTGSRIQRQDYTANSPIVTVDQESFQNTSTIGLETILNQLPQFIPAAFTQFNTTNVEPNPYQTPGTSNVSLRGLGANRNLVLVDGRRAVPVNAANAVDTNSIPSSAVQRVEIISGGASAVYGADAVGGVVNFILKDDFEGFQADAQYGLSELGDAAEFRISALWGANTADGRGNVMFGGEHSSRGKASSNDRDWFRNQMEDPYTFSNAEFWFSDTYYLANTVFASHPTFFLEGTPDQAVVDSIFPDAAPGTVANNANFFINRTPDGTGTVYTGGHLFGGIFGPTAPGPGAGVFGAEPDGGYKYAGPTNQADYPDGPTWRKQLPNGEWLENQLANFLSTPLDRYSMFGRGKYDISDNVTAFFDGRFAKTTSRTLLQYSPANNGWSVDIPHGDDLYEGSMDGFGNTLPEYQAGGAYGLNCPAVGGCTQSEAFPTPPELAMLLDSRTGAFGDASSETWALNRNLDFLPRRQTANRSTNYQVTIGLEGTLPNDWVWDASLSHGEADGLIQSIGFASLGAYRAIATSPNYGVNFYNFENPGHGTFASGIGSCTSGLPLIRDFAISEDCVKALSLNMQETSYMRMTTGQANITGDLFELPAGMLSFALGAEYREQEYEFQTDPAKSIDGFVDQPVGIFPAGSTKGGQSVSEIYGELLVPIVADLPGIQHLNLELGGRYSEYNDVGGTETYKALADWLITDWARFRGGYNRANRAPNIGELYQARTTQAFAPAGIGAVNGDPCNPNNTLSPVSIDPATNEDGAAGAAHAQMICEALIGSPTAVTQFYANAPAAGGNGAAGMTGQNVYVGNPNLTPEVADTWTAGLVMTSPFDNPWTSGLQLSVDYYKISIDDLIGQKPIDSIYYECLDDTLNPGGDINSSACGAIVRSPTSGLAQEIEVPYTNEASIELAGVDIQVNYSAQLADLGINMVPGGVNMNLLATIPETVKYRASQGAGWNTGYIGTQSSPPQTSGSYYDYTMFTTFNYFTGPMTASLRWQYYPPIDPGACRTDPNCNRDLGITKSYSLFGLSGSYRLNDTVLLRAGVDNLLDKIPPVSGGNPNQAVYASPPTRNGGGVYDPIGRRFFVGANVTF